MLIGVAAARLASSQIKGLLFGLDAIDPVGIAGALAVLALVAMFAAVLPARGAAAINPTEALTQRLASRSSSRTRSAPFVPNNSTPCISFCAEA